MAKYWIGGNFGTSIYHFNSDEWVAQTLPDADEIREISGVDENIVFALGSTYLFKTTDGGDNWVRTAYVGIPKTLGWIHFNYGLSAVSETEVYIAYATHVFMWNGSTRSEVFPVPPTTLSTAHGVHAEGSSRVYVENDLYGIGQFCYSSGTGWWPRHDINDWTDTYYDKQIFGNQENNLLVTSNNRSDRVQVATGGIDAIGSNFDFTSTILKAGFFYKDVGPDWPVYCKCGCVDPYGTSYVSANDTTTGNNQIAVSSSAGVWTYVSLGSSNVSEPGAIWVGYTTGCCAYESGATGKPSVYTYDGANWTSSTELSAETNPPLTVWGYEAPAATGTSDDLATATGGKRNLFAKIHGYEPILWQYSDKGEPAADYDRSIITCLNAPTELGMGLNLAEGIIDINGMTLELDNVKDTDTTYTFAKEFAPAAWEANGHVRQRSTIAPSDTSITTSNSSGQIDDAAGTLYIGSETITYTGTTDTGAENTKGEELWTIDGITRDVYPCIDGTSLGRRYQIPDDNEGGNLLPISTKPFSYIGRMVALYAVTWNKDAEKWNSEDDAQLVWVGRISDSIEFDGARGKWLVSCESLVSDLDKKVASKARSTTLGKGINLCGVSEQGRTVQIDIFYPGKTSEILYMRFKKVVAAGYYTPEHLIVWLNVCLKDDDNWTTYYGAVGLRPSCVFSIYQNSKVELSVTHNWNIYVDIVLSNECHIMQALGFDVANNSSIRTILQTTELSYTSVEYRASKGFYRSYFPLKQKYNGGKLMIKDSTQLITDAGDHHSGEEIGTVKIKNIKSGEEKITGYFRYNDIGSENLVMRNDGDDTLELMDANYMDDYVDELAFIGTGDDRAPAEVEQIFIPWPVYAEWQIAGTYTYRGPFEMLLMMMISTGGGNRGVTGSNYSGSGFNYDVLHEDYGLGIPQQLIDIDSFEEANDEIRGSSLFPRYKWPIEAESVKDLISRECKLFGFALVWRNGQFAIVKTMPPAVDVSEVTIDESNIIDVLFQPKLSMSSGAVINQYNCNVNFNMYSNKFEGATVITDVDSVNSLQQTRSTRIEHKGIFHAIGERVSATDLTGLLLNRFIRYPMPTIQVPIAPTLINQVFVGDTVTFNSSKCPDPFGGGTMTTSAYAIVLNLSWDFRNSWMGNCTLLLLAQAETYGLAWANSALVDQSATNGGWSSGSYQLTLIPYEFGDASTDDEDGAAFSAGDFIRVIERDPEDPTSLLSWGPFEIDKAYEADGANLLTLVNTTTMSTWDSEKEYIIQPGDYSEAVAAQKAAVTYIADNNYFVDGTTKGYLIA